LHVVIAVAPVAIKAIKLLWYVWKDGSVKLHSAHAPTTSPYLSSSRPVLIFSRQRRTRCAESCRVSCKYLNSGMQLAESIQPGEQRG
jgi:hypothetical protein